MAKNDVYTAYLQMGSPSGRPDARSHLPDDVLVQLRGKCTGKPETRAEVVRPNELLRLDLPLRENDVYMITLEP